MTVGELVEALSKLPAEAQVFGSTDYGELRFPVDYVEIRQNEVELR